MRFQNLLFGLLSAASCSQLIDDLSEYTYWEPKPSIEAMRPVLDQRSLPDQHGLDSLANYLLNPEAKFECEIVNVLVAGRENCVTNLCTAIATRSLAKLDCVVKAYGLPPSILEVARDTAMSTAALLEHVFVDLGMYSSADGLMVAAYKANNPSMVRALHKVAGVQAVSFTGLTYLFQKGNAELYRAAFESGLPSDSLPIPKLLFADLELLRLYLRSGPPKSNINRLLETTKDCVIDSGINDGQHIKGWAKLLYIAGADKPAFENEEDFGEILEDANGIDLLLQYAWYELKMRQALTTFSIGLDKNDDFWLPKDIKNLIVMKIFTIGY